MTQYLSKDSLFLKLPTDLSKDEISVLDLYHDITSLTTTPTPKVTFDSIINKTYYLLKSTNDISNALKLWQIRLTCHLFNNQLSYAKKELINLNNTLYLQENHNITPPPPPPAASSSSSLSLSNGSTPNATTTTTTNNNPIYPLPKNNQLIIDFKLLILLLRLKNFPNMNLINELYKLIYQLRLKRNDNINNDQISLLLVKNLQNLSYDNIVILTLTKNYLTLINFLSNLIQELKELKDSEDKKQNMANSFDCEYKFDLFNNQFNCSP